EPVSLATLHRMLSDHLGFREPVSVGELIARLRSRHLVIDTAQGVTPPGFLLELVTHYLLHAIASEIVEGRPDLISTCPLAQASWPDRVREHQRTFLLLPLIDRIAKAKGFQIQSVKGLLREGLRHLASGAAMQQDYTVANVLYLMEAAGEEFVDLDLHELTIRGADFRPSWLHRSNLTDTDLTGSAFAQRFGTLHSIALSPDAEATYLAVGTSQGRVLVWLRENGELIAERQSHSEVVRSLCFATDSKSIYSGGEDGRLVAWYFGANKTEVVNEAHGNWIWSVDLAEDLQRLITTGGDGHVKLWDLDCLRETLAIRFPHPWIWSVVYSRGRLVCGSEDGSVWSCQISVEGKRPHAVGQYRLESRFDYPVKSLSFSAQNPNVVFVGCTGGFIYSLDMASKEVRTFGPRHRGVVRSIVALPGRGLVASAGDDKLIRVWKAKDGSAVRLLEGHSSRIWSLSSHNTLPLVASAGDDRSAKTWRTDGPTHPERSLYGVEHSVRSLDMDGSEAIIAACCDDVVRRWDGDFERTDNVIVHRHARLTVARAVGQTYIAAADDGSISVRADHEPLRTWAAHEGAIECLRIERYRGIIASGGEDRVVRLWSFGGDLLAELSYHRNRIWDLAFSPNGRYLITGGGDHAVGLWTVEDGQLQAALLGHQNLVLAVSWLSDDVFVTGSYDGTVRFWKIGANANGDADLTKVVELDFVVREIVCSGDGEGLVLVGGRSRQPETGAKLVCLNGQGKVLSTITGILKGAIRALELDMTQKSLFVGGDGTDIVKFEIGNELIEKKRLHIDGPYEGAILSRAIGLSDGQRKTLRDLGASL
ncbi:MAG TPA: WD40 repeat domain-containing protein, partial [Anaerolineales bacterium]|nr:WD40 repeat domain-containing protein [Anaerolineales bacterium]